MLFALFVLICIAGSVAIAILLRDSYVFNKMNHYGSLLDEHGDDSQEEYSFREMQSETIGDLCHLMRATRDSACLQLRLADAAQAKKCEPVDTLLNTDMGKVLAKVVKKSRKAKPNRGKR